ncbi:type I secretion system permease/ATPase [Marivita sp.]|uniref:type I secretion system permease/ATPase n=1 Tax=Marivita sp. TaxID=2003365 RepID=UPI003F6C012C
MDQTTSLQLGYQKFRSIYAATIVFSFFGNLLMFVGPLYMLQVYDRVLTSRNETTLAVLTLIALAMLVSYGLLELIRTKLLVRAGLQFDEIVANPVFHRVVKQKTVLPGGHSQIALSDIDRVREFLTGHGVLAFFDAPWVPIYLALCFAFHPWLGMVATSGAAIIFGLALANEVITRRALIDAGEAAQGASFFANATMQNAEVIQALGMEEPLTSSWSKRHDKMLFNQALGSDRAGLIMATSKSIRMSLQIAIIGVGAFLAINQEISPGVMIAASIIMGRALSPVEQAVGQWKQFVVARTSHKRLKLLFDNTPDDEERVKLPAPEGHLSVEGLCANVPGAHDPLLRGVSFGLHPGEVLTIVGPSGSGKTTLVRHLVGASIPVAGAVRLDGTELQHWQPRQLGRYMGYLPQDVKLFGGTIAENISRFEENPKDADIVAAAKLAGAHEMIQRLSNGYSTDVGERGIFLSGGEKQRIGPARAVYRNPSLIVLDEPASNLDSVGEQALAACVQEVKAMGKTVILITHKANLLSLSDKTLMLVNGMVEKFAPTSDFFGRRVETDPQEKVAHAHLSKGVDSKTNINPLPSSRTKAPRRT